MSQARRRAAGLVVALGCALGATSLAALVAPGAHAADDAEIAGFQRTDTGLVVSVNVPPSADLDLGGVTATVNGAPVDGVRAKRFEEGDVAVDRIAVLAIDTSNSMRGDRIEAAKAAATTYLEALPPDVRVGIVSFSSTAETVLEPTDERGVAGDVIDSLTLSKQTRLFDGVLEALDLAGDDGQRSVLVLSDGRDTASGASAQEVAEAVKDSGVSVSVVALQQSAEDREVLATIAGGDDRVIDSTSQDLGRDFRAQARLLAAQVVVTIPASDDVLADPTGVEISLPQGQGELTAASTYAGDVSDAPSEPSVDGPPVVTTDSLPSWVMYLAVALVFAALLVGLVTLVPAPRVVPRSPQARIASYTVGLVPGARGSKQDEPALAQATEAVAGVLRRNQGLDERISARLLAAGSALRSPEWLLLHAGIAVGGLAVGLLLGRGNPAVGILFLLLGLVLPWVYLGLRGNRRRRQFESALPETLQLMAGSLSAGLSMLQAIDTIVREGSDPVASEFRRVLVEIRLGVALDVALEGVADRFNSRDFRWVVMAIRIQRQVGGNLAELLTTVSTTIREREYIRNQVAALAAEGKLSAIVLGALPPAFLLYLVAAQPSYVEPLFNDTRGLIMLVGGAVWLGIGIFAMSRLIKVEV